LQKPPTPIIITLYMKKNYVAMKYEADKIALLGLFIVGLLIAGFITSARYSRPRKAGAKVVDQIKRKGISGYLDDQLWQSCFLISNAKGTLIGFAMDVFTSSPTDLKLNIKAAGLLYTRGRFGREQAMSFQSDNSFAEFSWRSETAAPPARTGTRITLEQDGVLTVTKFNQDTKQHSYKPGSSAIPDFLLDFVFTQMLESDYPKIIVDTITADGKIVEVAVSKAGTEDSRPSQTEAPYKLNVDFLGEPRISQQVYLDSRKRIVQIRRNGTYLFERTSTDDILKQFPEQADRILQRNRILEQSRP
jgi:hypothetical protein